MYSTEPLNWSPVYQSTVTKKDCDGWTCLHYPTEDAVILLKRLSTYTASTGRTVLVGN